MALTEEEKQKIIEEELFRKEQQDKLKITSSHINGIVSFVLGVVSFFLGIFGIVLAPAGLYLGFKSKKIEKSPWAWAGIITNSLFIVYIAVVVLLGVSTLSFVGDIQSEDANYAAPTYAIEQNNKYDMYMSTDSVGRDILDLNGVDIATQISVWNESKLKKEYLELFPDFDYMKDFVKERINGKPLVAKLLKQLDTVEDKFFSGSITAEGVKKELQLLK